MTLGEKIATLRKENNYTQEQLAQILGVSRQAISKWESDVAYPETEKLIRMGKLFDCSMDYLLKEECEDRSGHMKSPEVASFIDDVSNAIRRQCRERKSGKTVWGMPLYHIAKNARGFFAVGQNAKGVFAVGLKAQGIVSLGLLSFGVLSIGLLSIGVIAFGTLALGLLSVGSIALGLFAAGAISVGVLSFGALAVGELSAGAMATGKYLAIGDNARAMIALGDTQAAGTVFQKVGELTPEEVTRVKALLDAHVPGYLAWAKAIMKYFLG